MALAQTLNGVKRELRTKGYLKDLKRGQMIPAVVYGQGRQPLPIAVEGRTLNRVFSHYGYRGLFSLELQGEKPFMVLVREVQRHPINHEVTHLDFLAVSMTEKITSTVPIQVSGEEEIQSRGGILQLGAKEAEVSCLPGDLPEAFRCDVAELEIGAKITLADLSIPATVELLGDPETVVAVILGANKATADEPSEENLESQGQAEASE